MASSDDPAIARALLAAEDEVRYQFSKGKKLSPYHNLIPTSISELQNVWAHKRTVTTPQHLQAKFPEKPSFDTERTYELMIELLDHLPDYLSEHVVLAGGSIMARVAGIKPSDFDLFIVGIDHPEAVAYGIFKHWSKYATLGFMKRSTRAISVYLHVMRGDIDISLSVQISLFACVSPSQVAHSTDSEPTCFVYHQGQLYGTERGLHGLKTNTLYIALSRFREEYSSRLVKYSRRYGFYVYTPTPVTSEIYKLSNIIHYGGPKVSFLLETTLAGLVALLNGARDFDFKSKPDHLKMISNRTHEVVDLVYRIYPDTEVTWYGYSGAAFPFENLFEPGVSGEPEWKTLSFAPLVFFSTDAKMISDDISPGQWVRSSTDGLDLTDYKQSLRRAQERWSSQS